MLITKYNYTKLRKIKRKSRKSVALNYRVTFTALNVNYRYYRLERSNNTFWTKCSQIKVVSSRQGKGFLHCHTTHANRNQYHPLWCPVSLVHRVVVPVHRVVVHPMVGERCKSICIRLPCLHNNSRDLNYWQFITGMLESLVGSHGQLQSMIPACAHKVLANSSSMRFVSLVDFDQYYCFLLFWKYIDCCCTSEFLNWVYFNSMFSTEDVLVWVFYQTVKFLICILACKDT